MREALVAVFDTAAHADEAVRALEKDQVAPTDIRRYHKDDPNIPHANYLSEPEAITPPRDDYAAGRSGGFWSWLMGEDRDERTEWHDPNYAERDEMQFARRIGEGNTVVAVYCEPTDTDRVLGILEKCHPLAAHDTGEVEGVSTTGTTTGAAATARPTDAGLMGRRHGEDEQTIPLAEEQLEVGKRRIERPVHVRRYVVERPVEQQVTLQDERVEIERRRPAQSQTPGAGQFEERTVEVRESHEEPVVNKTAAVTEEVVVRRETGEHTETVRETVRKDDIAVDRDNKPEDRAADPGKPKV